MQDTDRFMVVLEGPDANVVQVPHNGEVIDTVPCTFRNATDRIVYVWHWPRDSNLYREPHFVLSIEIGASVTMFYPVGFYTRATLGGNALQNMIQEAVVGDIPKHLVLIAETHSP